MECPNCQTPWKCNGPHLLWIDDSIASSGDGYFYLQNNEWAWLPFERHYSKDELFSIVDTLSILNERLNNDRK
jgi:hypothetical protein